RRQRGAPESDFRTRRNLVPHVGHGGNDAGGAARALSHAPIALGALLRRLSRLVGRCAAGDREPAAGARELYVEGDVGRLAARAADATWYFLRARQSAAGVAPQRAAH